MWSTRSAAAFSSSARALVPPDPSSSRRTLYLADCRFATNEEIRGQNIALIDEYLETGVALDLFTIQQLGGVVADVAYVFGDLEGLHLVGGERPQEVDRRLVGDLAVEPAVEVAGVQDDGHAVVDLCHELVRFGGDDGVALHPLGLAIEHIHNHGFVELCADDALDDKAIDRELDSSLDRIRCLFPRVPEAGEGQHLSVGEVEGEGLFVLCIELSQAVPSLGTQEECLSLTERPPSR